MDSVLLKAPSTRIRRKFRMQKYFYCFKNVRVFILFFSVHTYLYKYEIRQACKHLNVRGTLDTFTFLRFCRPRNDTETKLLRPTRKRCCCVFKNSSLGGVFKTLRVVWAFYADKCGRKAYP